ncbi:MAG: ribosome small subunit-dependent GTPase A [Moraxella sp.]|nr:ribosome small subunit-dependent GTPase A [Moraxella sp.]
MLIRKRKLTQNQSRQIAQNNEQVDDSLLHTGVIVSHFGKQLLVQLTALASTPSNTDTTPEHPTPTLAPKLGDIVRCHTRTNLPMMTVGDTVKISYTANDEFGRIEKLGDRTTLITRPDRYHKVKPVAANVDLLVVVFAPLPKPATSLIDRYLLIAHLSQVPVLLVLNKADLIDADTQKIYDEYQALGINMVMTSITNPDSLATLTQHLTGKLAIFAGQSGVGKSSIINHLLPDAEQSTNMISEISKLGQHTTTTSRLLAYDPFDLGKGGVIDTPGIREYGVWHLSKDTILGAFSELASYNGDCAFRDCTHAQNAKGCALWQAVEKGEVLARRVESLLELQAEAGSVAGKK